jgi:hypothetical protein
MIHGMRALLNLMLRRTFGPKREEVEVIGEQRKLYNEKLSLLVTFIRVIKSMMMRLTWHVICMGEGGIRNGHSILIGKSGRKRRLGRPRRRRKDNI